MYVAIHIALSFSASKSFGIKQRSNLLWPQVVDRMSMKAMAANESINMSPTVSPTTTDQRTVMTLPGGKGTLMVDQNVFVTSSQQVNTTDTGMIRTTSQQFSSTRVQSVVSKSTCSFGDIQSFQIGSNDQLSLPGMESQAGSKELSLSPMSNRSDALVPIGQSGSETDKVIEATLNRTMETFQGMFQKQREQFMQMFPQFKNLRADCAPEIITETRVQPDGTVLVIEKQRTQRVMKFR